MTDPDYITETDMADWPGNGPWVECEWGYESCTGADYAEDMVRQDSGWMCPACQRQAKNERRES